MLSTLFAVPSFRPHSPGVRATAEIIPDLTVVDIENAVGSRLMLVELGLAPPLAVEGRYRILRLLGRGARGVVCRAYDDHLRREVALKLYPAYEPGAAASEVASEAQALARLEHANIVNVYDFGDASLAFEPGDLGAAYVEGQAMVLPCFFMSMEQVRGQSLRRWLAVGDHGREAVLQVFAAAGEGLVHAHELGVVHRDFKPENVMLDDRGRVLVVDFGLASRRPGTHEPTTTTTAIALWQAPRIVGTPEYMAPEARVGRASASSDQYSFAMSLHEALLGELPPVTEAGLVHVDLRRFPAALGRVLARALAFDPQHRYPSMRELLHELPRRWDDQWRWQPLDDEPAPRRSPPWALLAVGGVLLVGGLGVYAGARLFGVGDDDGAGTVSKRDGATALVGGRCPSDALIGRWQLESLDLWDFKLARRRVRGHYTLDIAKPAPGSCALEATLSKTGSSVRPFETPLTGPPVPLTIAEPDPRGRVELGGEWWITDGKIDQHLEFSLRLDGEVLRGDYHRFVEGGDGIERPSMIGPAYAARWGRALPRVDGVADVPCPSQCNIVCAGDGATAQCRARQCIFPVTSVDDCGPPSADFVDPYTTNKKLRELATDSWKPVRDGRACHEVPALLAGNWTVWSLDDDGTDRRFDVELRSRDCELVGTAVAGDERHAIVGEIDDQGRWLVRDPGDPDALVWALQGWDFAFGSSGGGRPGRLSAYKKP